MQVQKIDNSVYPNKELHSPNFRAKGLDPRIIESLAKDGTRMSRFLAYAGENQGEVLNILVTAFGTAIICPMFIRFNPFSKEDKQTRAYSAWRQPISAIITVITQLSITKWFNNHLARKASTSNKKGEANYKRADLRACPHERTIGKVVNELHPDWSKKDKAAEIKKIQLDHEKAVIEQARKDLANTRIETNDLICQEYLDNAEKEFLKKFRNQHTENMTNKMETFSKKVRSFMSGANLDKYNELESKLKEWIPDPNKNEYNKLEKEILDLLPEQYHEEFKELGKQINIRPKKFAKMAEARFMVLAEDQGLDKASLIRQYAEKMVEKDIYSEAVIKTAVRDFQSQQISIEKAKEKCTKEKVLKFIESKGLTAKLGGEEGAEEIAKEVMRKLDLMKNYETANNMPEFFSVKNLGKTFDEILHNVKIKKLIKSRLSDSKKVFKTMNTQLGLVVNLATLPLTCGVLNWAYPRIMEKIMPEMAAKKKASSQPVNKEGGDK